MDSDRPPAVEQVQRQQEITARFQGAWNLVGQGVDSGYGTNLKAVARTFLRSVFYPSQFPSQDKFPPSVDPILVERLRGRSPYQDVQPSSLLIDEAETSLLQNVLDVEPPLVDKAHETIDALAKMARFSIWTVGDVAETHHQLPEELVGQKDTLPGVNHQIWKLSKVGLTNRPDVNILASDNKLIRFIREITVQETDGVRHFVIMDDTIGNLEKAKQLIEEENMARELAGEEPLVYDLIHVNQGRKRQVPPPSLIMSGTLGRFKSIDRFQDAPATLKELHPEIQEVPPADAKSDVAVFCDFDGVVTDNTQMRREWDKIAQTVVEDTVKKATLVNHQKEILPKDLTTEDFRPSSVRGYIEQCQSKGLTVAVINGAYDIPHRGHLEAWAEARDSCDVLVVLTNSDASIRKFKGIKDGVPRPVQDEVQRASMLLSNRNVDGVVIFDEPNPSQMLKELHPNIYISSPEYQGKDLEEFRIAEELGIEVIFTSPRIGCSTSNTINNILGGFLTNAEKVLGGDPEMISALEKLKVLAGLKT